MLTPTHMCLIITLNYFKADFFKTSAVLYLPDGALYSLRALGVAFPGRIACF